ERLLVMGALTTEELELALASGADLVAWRESFTDAVVKKAQEAGVRARLHVKLDTGMGRLGTKDIEEATGIAERAAGEASLSLAGVMTHFATADEPNSDFFDEQLRRFQPFADQIKQKQPDCVVHAANSAALYRDEHAHFDMARCGIAVYGLDPFHRDPSERRLEPALAFESYVADVKSMRAGDSAGYGRAWTATGDTHIAVVPVGYGDGYRRGLSNNAEVIVRGRRFRVAGTISMDNITVDVG